MSIQDIHPYPWFIGKPIKLVVNDETLVVRIGPAEWNDSWRPFLARLYDMFRQFKGMDRRLMVGIVGPPGAGKSVFAETVGWICYKGFLPGAIAVGLPMDGFHRPESWLEHHSRTLADHTKVSLIHFKGAPDTFDTEALRENLAVVREGVETVAWPGYSRVAHTTIPNACYVRPSNNLVMVEGNYLLLDKGPFEGFKDFFDLKIFLDTPPMKIVGNLMSRHLTSGKTVDWAKQLVKQNDLPNARLVELSRALADVIIERNADDFELTAVRWRSDSGELEQLAPAPKAPEPPPSEDLKYKPM